MLPLVLAAALALPSAPTAMAHPHGAPTGRTRVYYIAADEVIWDYAPSGINQITGKPFDQVQQMWAKQGPQQIGSKMKKALFREYTDAGFKNLKSRSADDAYLGFLGPVIRAEVGDTIRVVFRNNGTHPYSMHPHGVLYDKGSEGAGYADNTNASKQGDDHVQPGTTYTYTWIAADRAGPAAMEGSSVLWMYHSHVEEATDVNSGLFGPLIITARGKAKPDGSPLDVDKEIVIAFAEIDENLSWFIDENIKKFTLNPASVKKAMPPTFTDPFGVTNLKESINGFIYGNGPLPSLTSGDRVRWYIMSTTNFELHAPHWHGNVVTAQHMKTDVLTLGTMGMIVADMVPDNPGTWLFHCHIEPHLTAGMQMRYSVSPSATMAGKAKK
jgi:manganese oxidase